MNDINSKIRQKRFNLVPSSDVTLVIETNTGSKHELTVENCSLFGIGATSQTSLGPNDGIELNGLVPSAKLRSANEETTLGRLVVRRIADPKGIQSFAFSTIDCRVPVDGILSKFIKETLESRKSAYDFEMNSDKFSLGDFIEGNQTNIDLFHRTKQFSIFYKQWKDSSKYQYYNIRTASKGNRVSLKQVRKNGRQDYLVMSSNDYLGIASSPEVAEAAKKAIDQYGFGSTGSPVTTGLTDIHVELNSLLAKTFKKEACLLYNSGYAANIGAISGLARPQDLVIADVISHASIQDAMQMTRATCRFFKHNDVQHLEKLLQENRDSHKGAIVITEGVFSMDGDTPPFEKIVDIARKYNARVMLDEAHSFGVTGQTGLGCWENFSRHQPDIVMGTFSKICGGIGGFIASDSSVVEWLYSQSRAHLFSVSIPPSSAAAALAALNLFLKNPNLVSTLHENIKHFVNGLRSLGCPLTANHQSAVVPVVIGDEAKLSIMNEVFRDNGVFVVPIIYPAVGRKNCRFRFTMMATHSISDLDYVLNVIELAMAKANFKFQPSSAGERVA